MMTPRACALIIIVFLVIDGSLTAYTAPRDVAFSIALWAGATAVAVIPVSLVIRFAGVVKAPLVGGMVALCLGVLLLVIFVGAIGHIAPIVATAGFVALAAFSLVENVDKLLDPSK